LRAKLVDVYFSITRLALVFDPLRRKVEKWQETTLYFVVTLAPVATEDRSARIVEQAIAAVGIE